MLRWLKLIHVSKGGPFSYVDIKVISTTDVRAWKHVDALMVVDQSAYNY